MNSVLEEFDPHLSVGALLRTTYGWVLDDTLTALTDNGYADLKVKHMRVLFLFRGTSLRPVDAASALGQSRQATAYIIESLEERGYLERTPGTEGRKRPTVSLTLRGEAAVEVMIKAGYELSARLKDQLGEENFAIFLKVLQKLAGPNAT